MPSTGARRWSDFYAMSPRREMLDRPDLAREREGVLPGVNHVERIELQVVQSHLHGWCHARETVRLISKPLRRPLATTSRSSSAPAWVAQK